MRALARRLAWLLLAWALLVALPEWPWLRAWLARPLDVHDAEPRGQVAYVLASGPLSLGERLAAAADLWHEKRVERLLLADDPTPSRFDFRAGRARTAGEWAVAHLVWLGVPAERIERLPPVDTSAWLDTRAEAQAVRAWRPPEVDRLVLVSSPVHLRRARLAFERALGAEVTVQTFASSALPDGPDFQRPLWLEYLKLGLYWLFA